VQVRLILNQYFLALSIPTQIPMKKTFDGFWWNI